jgi:hypothetical protein
MIDDHSTGSSTKHRENRQKTDQLLVSPGRKKMKDDEEELEKDGMKKKVMKKNGHLLSANLFLGTENFLSVSSCSVVHVFRWGQCAVEIICRSCPPLSRDSGHLTPLLWSKSP